MIWRGRRGFLKRKASRKRRYRKGLNIEGKKETRKERGRKEKAIM
jgi:hypothetical protein